jgi:hypothetical protein
VCLPILICVFVITVLPFDIFSHLRRNKTRDKNWIKLPSAVFLYTLQILSLIYFVVVLFMYFIQSLSLFSVSLFTSEMFVLFFLSIIIIIFLMKSKLSFSKLAL